MSNSETMKLLKKKRVKFRLLKYPKTVRDTTLVAQHVDVSPNHLFKSLVVIDSTENPLIIMIPSNSRININCLYSILKRNGLKMATKTEAEELTGLQVGGISPLALVGKNIPVYIDQSVKQFNWIVMSAGQRGVAVKLLSSDLLKITKAQIIKIV